MNDRSLDVRRAFYEVLCNWMTKMELSYLRINEKHFLSFLLNGLSDDFKEISDLCLEFLEVHGKRMREALLALGEEQEEGTENTEMKSD
jgi:hypothetical protein